MPGARQGGADTLTTKKLHQLSKAGPNPSREHRIRQSMSPCDKQVAALERRIAEWKKNVKAGEMAFKECVKDCDRRLAKCKEIATVYGEHPQDGTIGFANPGRGSERNGEVVKDKERYERLEDEVKQFDIMLEEQIDRMGKFLEMRP